MAATRRFESPSISSVETSSWVGVRGLAFRSCAVGVPRVARVACFHLRQMDIPDGCAKSKTSREKNCRHGASCAANIITYTLCDFRKNSAATKTACTQGFTRRSQSLQRGESRGRRLTSHFTFIRANVCGVKISWRTIRWGQGAFSRCPSAGRGGRVRTKMPPVPDSLSLPRRSALASHTGPHIPLP